MYRVRNEIESISRDVIANADMISRKCSVLGMGETQPAPKMAQRVFVCNGYTYTGRKRERKCVREREREREREPQKGLCESREARSRYRIGLAFRVNISVMS